MRLGTLLAPTSKAVFFYSFDFVCFHHNYCRSNNIIYILFYYEIVKINISKKCVTGLRMRERNEQIE